MLLAVAPPELQQAVAALLASAGQDDVVVVARESEEPGGHFDAAVVIDLSTVDADVVIQLPDASGRPGIGTVRDGDSAERVRIDSAHRIVDLLDVYCPAHESRLDRLLGRTPPE